MVIKTSNKILFRRIKSQLGSFLATVVIIMVAVGFYVVLKTITQNYKASSEKYYANNSLSDYTFYGQFSQADIQRVESVAEFKGVEARNVLDGKNKDSTIRVISLPSKNPKINIPHIYSGFMPNNNGECLLLKKYADANGLKVGDKVDFDLSGKKYSLKISGLAASPEYVYLAKNAMTPMADPREFGVIFVNQGFFNNSGTNTYNEMLIDFKDDQETNVLIDKTKTVLGRDNINNEIKRKDLLSYSFYEDDLNQLSTFSYIFPIVFFFIAGVVIMVIQKRNVLYDRRQIGIMKALGLRDNEIIWLYTKYALLVSIAGVVLGIILSITVGPIILGLFKSMFEVPVFSYQNIFGYWALPGLISLLVCILASYLAIKGITVITPSEAMHAEIPRNGKDIFLQKTSLWNKLSFNSRYSIKAAVRNYGRFWAVIMGMVATITLAVFSFGFMDTFNEIIAGYYGKVAKYDLAIHVDKTPLDFDLSFLKNSQINKYEKSLLLPVKIESGNVSKDITLNLSDDIFSMYDVKDIEGKSVNLENGIAIPRQFARLLNLEIGDPVHVYTSDKKIDTKVFVSDITNQTTGFYALSSFNFAKKNLNLDTLYYNTIFARTNGDIEKIKTNLENTVRVLSVTSKSDDEKTLTKMLEVFKTYIYILIFFAIVLGVAVLYSISTINLASRNYEFVILKVMGYSTREIIFAYIKELFLQIIISIPFGFILGNFVLFAVNGAFSTDSFEMVNNIYPISYLYSVILLTLIVGIILINAKKQVDRLDLVEGLKSREE